MVRIYKWKEILMELACSMHKTMNSMGQQLDREVKMVQCWLIIITFDTP